MKRIRLVSYLALALMLGALVSYAQPMTIVNGASFDPNGPFAPGSFAAMFGEHLCAQTAAGEWIGPGQLPTELGGCSVSVNGVPAMMHYTSRNQINFIVPDGLGPGRAQVVTRNGPNSSEGTMQIGRAGPGIFARNGMGMGLGAMLHSTLWQDGPFSVTTDGQPTHVSIYMTGLDLTTGPVVDAGGVPVEVTWFGNVPGFVGLQQINIVLPEELAGAGMTPMTVTSGGVTSNVTYMNILPTTSMMEGMPGWGPGMEVGQNGKRGREMSYLTFNESNNTALVTDEEDDALRVISMDSFQTVQTITLPENSEAHAVAVNAAGTLAAVALSHNAAVALINLQQPDDMSIIGTGTYPRHLAFVGADLLVTNAASGTVTVIDTTARVVTRAIAVGFGPTGIAADQTRAVVCNTQAGSVSVINLADYSVNTLDLAPGARPHGVAIDSALNKAVITTPQSNSFQILNLATNEFTQVETEIWNARGPGAVVIANARAYIANQMTASITAVDLNANTVMNTFRVDPGPRALAADPARNRLLVLSHGTGVLSAVDLESYAIVGRADATDGDRDGRWTLPTITAVTPSSAQRGTTFTMTITGNNLHDVEEIEFHVMGPSAGPGPVGSMGPGAESGPGPGSGGMMKHDENIETSNLQVSQDGAQITVTVEVLAEAALGTRRIGLATDRGDIMAGPMFDNWFTITE